MMGRLIILLSLILVFTNQVAGQGIGSQVEVVTIYSQNGNFYLKSIPYDNGFPTLPGKTTVFATGKSKPLYAFDRGFDSVEDDSNNLILSNDGELIFYAVTWQANEQVEGLKSVNIYRHGKIVKSFTEIEVNGCVKTKERCSLVYSNYDKVVDQVKSNFGSKNYKKVFHEGVDEKEKFLSDFPIFSFDDLVYLTDSKKNLHVFDLEKAELVSSTPFDVAFEQIKNKGRFTRTKLSRYESPIFLDFPNLSNGRNSNQALGRLLGLTSVSNDDNQYKLYRFRLKANILRDGSLEIEESEFRDNELPKELILNFFRQHKFDRRSVPKIFEKWSLDDQYFHFRNKNAAIARQERKEELKEQRKNLEQRLTLEKIDGVYIPKDLGECLGELDRLLPEVDKQEMKALAKRESMIKYHLGLGTWMRNNWSLWGGSRLTKYFSAKGVGHPEAMSSIVLFRYYDWLHDQKDTWKDWEKNPKLP